MWRPQRTVEWRKDDLETRLREQAAADMELQRKRFEQTLAEDLAKQAKEMKAAAADAQEIALLEAKKAHANKVTNVEAAHELAKVEALSEASRKVRLSESPFVFLHACARPF